MPRRKNRTVYSYSLLPKIIPDSVQTKPNNRSSSSSCPSPIRSLPNSNRWRAVERFDRLDGSQRRLEERLESMKIGVGGGRGGRVEEAVKRVDMEEQLRAKIRGFITEGDDIKRIGSQKLDWKTEIEF